MIPAKFNGDTEAYKNYLRRLKNFRGWTEDRLDAYVRAKEGGEADPLAVANESGSLEESLAPRDRLTFRQEVKRLLDAIVKAGGHREIMRPLAEKAAFYSLIIDKSLKADYLGQQVNQRNVKEMIDTYKGIMEALGVTPKEMRLRGEKSDESLAGALRQSLDSGRSRSREATETEVADGERYGRPPSDPVSPEGPQAEDLPTDGDGSQERD